jgi:hypothetical protein
MDIRRWGRWLVAAGAAWGLLGMGAPANAAPTAPNPAVQTVLSSPDWPAAARALTAGGAHILPPVVTADREGDTVVAFRARVTPHVGRVAYFLVDGHRVTGEGFLTIQPGPHGGYLARVAFGSGREIITMNHAGTILGYQFIGVAPPPGWTRVAGADTWAPGPQAAAAIRPANACYDGLGLVSVWQCFIIEMATTPVGGLVCEVVWLGAMHFIC